MKDTLTHKGLFGSVHYNANDRVFFGKIEGINDLVTFEGTTVDELENAFKFMVDEHIKDCEEEGTCFDLRKGRKTVFPGCLINHPIQIAAF